MIVFYLLFTLFIWLFVGWLVISILDAVLNEFFGESISDGIDHGAGLYLVLACIWPISTVLIVIDIIVKLLKDVDTSEKIIKMFKVFNRKVK